MHQFLSGWVWLQQNERLTREFDPIVCKSIDGVEHNANNAAERADWPKQHDMFKARVAKHGNANFRYDFRLDFVLWIC